MHCFFKFFVWRIHALVFSPRAFVIFKLKKTFEKMEYFLRGTFCFSALGKIVNELFCVIRARVGLVAPEPKEGPSRLVARQKARYKNLKFFTQFSS